MTVTPDIVAKQTYYPLPMEGVDPRAEDTHDHTIAAEESSIPYVNSFGAGVLQRLIRSGAVPPDGLLKEGRAQFRIAVPAPEKVLSNLVFPSKSKISDGYSLPLHQFLKAFHASLAQFGDVVDVVMIGSGVAYAVGADLLLSVLPEACRAPIKQFPDLFQPKVPSDFDIRIVISKKADSKVLSPEHLKIAAERVFHSFYLRKLRFELAFKISMHHKSFQEYNYNELLMLISNYDTPEKLDSLRIMHADGRNINNVRQKMLVAFLKDCKKCGHDPQLCEPLVTRLIFPKLPRATVPALDFNKCESLAKIVDNKNTLEGVSITLEGDIPVDISCIVLDTNENERFEHQRLGLSFHNLEKEVTFELYGCLQAPFDLCYRIFNWTKVKCDHNDWLAYVAQLSQGVPSPRDREGPRLLGITTTHFEIALGLKNAIETFNKIKGQSDAFKAICLLSAAIARGLTPEEQPLFFQGYEELKGVLGKIVGVIAKGQLSLNAAAALLQIAACRILLSHDLGAGNQAFRVGLQTHARVPVVVYAFPEGTLMIPLNLREAIASLHDVPQEALDPLLGAVGGVNEAFFNPESPLKQDAALLVDFLSLPIGAMEGPEPQYILFTRLMQHYLYPSLETFMGLLRNHEQFVEGVTALPTLGQLLNSQLQFFAEGDRYKLDALLPAAFAPEGFNHPAYVQGMIGLIDQQLFDEGLNLLVRNPEVLTPRQKWDCIRGLLGQGRLLRVLKVMQIAQECNEGAPLEWRGALDTIVTVIVGMRGQERERKLSLCRKTGDLLLWAMQTFQERYDFVERFEEFASLCRESCYADLDRAFQPYIAAKREDLHRQNMLQTIERADRRAIQQSVESMLQFAGSFPHDVSEACLSFLRKCYLEDTQHSLEVLLTLLANPQFTGLFPKEQAGLCGFLDHVACRYRYMPHLFSEILKLMEFSPEFSLNLLQHMLREGAKQLEKNPGKETLLQAKLLLSRCSAVQEGQPYLYLQLILNLLDHAADPLPLISALDALEAFWSKDMESSETLHQVSHLIAGLFSHRSQQMFDRALSWIQTHPQACSDEEIWKFANEMMKHRRWLRATQLHKLLFHSGKGTSDQWQNLLNQLTEAILTFLSDDPERKKKLVLETGSLAVAAMLRYNTSLQYVGEIETLRTLCKNYEFHDVTKGFDAIAAADQSKEEESQMAKDFSAIPVDHPLPTLKALVNDKTHLPVSIRALFFSLLKKMPMEALQELIDAIHAAPEFSGLLSNEEFRSELVYFLDQLLQRRQLLSGSLTTIERFFSLPYAFSTATQQAFLSTLTTRIESEATAEDLEIAARVLNRKETYGQSIDLQEAVQYLGFHDALKQVPSNPALVHSYVVELIALWKLIQKRDVVLLHIKTCFATISEKNSDEFYETLALLDEYIATLSKKQQNKCQPLHTMVLLATSLLDSSEPTKVLKGGELFRRTFQRGAAESDDLNSWMDCLTRFIRKSEQMPTELMPIFNQIHGDAIKMIHNDNSMAFFEMMADEMVEHDDKDMVVAFIIDICSNIGNDKKLNSKMRTFYADHLMRLIKSAMDETVSLSNLMHLRNCLTVSTLTQLFPKEEITKLMGECTKHMWKNMFSADSFLMRHMTVIFTILNEAFASNSIFTTETPLPTTSVHPQLKGDRLMFYNNIKQIVDHLERHILDDLFTPDTFLRMVIAHAFSLFEVLATDEKRELPKSSTYLSELFSKLEKHVLLVREAYQNFQIHSKPMRQTLPPVLMEFLIYVFRNFKPTNAAGEAVMASYGATLTKILIEMGFEIADLMNLQIYRTPSVKRNDVQEAFNASLISRSLLLFLRHIETLPIKPHRKRLLELEFRILTQPYFGLPEDMEDVAFETLEAMCEKMNAPGALPCYSFIKSYIQAVRHYGANEPFKQLRWYRPTFVAFTYKKISVKELITNMDYIMQALLEGLKMSKYHEKEKMEWTGRVVDMVVATINSLEEVPYLNLTLQIRFLDLLEELSKPQPYTVEARYQKRYQPVLFGIKTHFQAIYHQFHSRYQRSIETSDLRFHAIHEYYLTLAAQIHLVHETRQDELKSGLLAKAFSLFDLALKEFPLLDNLNLPLLQRTALNLLISSKTIVNQKSLYDFGIRQAMLIPFLATLLQAEDEHATMVREMLFACYAKPASEFADDPAHPIFENFFNLLNFCKTCSPANAGAFANYVASQLWECERIVKDPRFIELLPSHM